MSNDKVKLKCLAEVEFCEYFIQSDPRSEREHLGCLHYSIS